MMRAWIAAAALALAPTALAQSDEEALQSLIEENVRSRGLILQAPDGRSPQEPEEAPDALGGLIGAPPPGAPPPTARVWVHVRSARQLETAGEINARLADSLPVAVEAMPVQEVEYGPRRAQVRFFKEADRATAEAVRDAVAELLPDVTTQDLSAEYGAAGWIEPGHIEVWLAPPR